jgi:rod shape determining protein RodA
MDWFCNYCIICTNLILEPQYVILLALLVILIVYFKSRLGDRNILLSSILFALISGFVLSVSYVFQNVFKQHHRDRFNILLGKTVDLKGIGYNTNQSEIAIGSEDGSEEVFSRELKLKEDLYRNNILITSLPLVKNGAL